MVQRDIRVKRPDTPIDNFIQAFEATVGAHGVHPLQTMNRPTRIETIYEGENLGAIVARFVPEGGPRFNVEVDGTVRKADAYILYVGFNEASNPYRVMVSDVERVLRNL